MDSKSIRRANMLLLVEQHRTLRALAERTGTDPAHLSQIKGRHRDMGEDVARRIEKGLGLPTGWMDVPQGSHVAQPGSIYNASAAPHFRARVPLISWTTAGKWAEAHDQFAPGDGEDWVPTTASVGPNAFALRVVGDSMEPRIPDGAIVVIDPSRSFKHGSIVLAKRTQDQEATLKQLWYDGAVPKLRPLNQRYPILEMPEDTRIIGVAVKIELDL